MTRILFLIPTLMHGGAEKVLVNLVNNLDPAKYDITLYSIFDGGVNKEFLSKNVRYRYKFKRIFRGNSQLMKLFSPEFLYRYFIKEDYDVLVSYLEGPAARIISGSESNAKKIAWIHTEMTTNEVAATGFRNFTEAKKLYSRFDHVVGVSQKVMQCFREKFNVAAPLHVLYNVNETENIREKSKKTNDLLSAKDVLKISSVGKLTKNKGFDRLINIHEKLLKEGLKHEVHIFGIGEEQASLEREVSKMGVRASFHFHGFQLNPYQFMSKCDLYVCSSHREGFSTAVTEALIVGIPVVSTDCSGAKEMLGENNEYGIVTENSTEGLYHGLKAMLSAPQTLQHYRQQARIRGDFFSKENRVKAAEDFFDSLL